MQINEYLKIIDEVNEKGKYKPDWQSLTHHKVPSWYMCDKVGVFIHWGVYSVPAYGNEWYSRNMYGKDSPEYEHHIKTYGQHKDFGYKDFIPMFKAEKFDASKWIKLFKDAGIKYVMPVCEHHDGFAMYETEFNRWNSVNMGPCRDVAGELKAECEKNGLTFCAGSLSAGAHNDVVKMAEKFAKRTHFVHLRSCNILPDGNFIEASHLEGRGHLVDLIRIFERHEKADLPMRVDHGRTMLGDEDKGYNPGYSFHGRMLALGQVDGMMAVVRDEIRNS